MYFKVRVWHQVCLGPTWQKGWWRAPRSSVAPSGSTTWTGNRREEPSGPGRTTWTSSSGGTSFELSTCNTSSPPPPLFNNNKNKIKKIISVTVYMFSFDLLHDHFHVLWLLMFWYFFFHYCRISNLGVSNDTEIDWKALSDNWPR